MVVLGNYLASQHYRMHQYAKHRPRSIQAIFMLQYIHSFDIMGGGYRDHQTLVGGKNKVPMSRSGYHFAIDKID